MHVCRSDLKERVATLEEGLLSSCRQLEERVQVSEGWPLARRH